MSLEKLFFLMWSGHQLGYEKMEKIMIDWFITQEWEDFHNYLPWSGVFLVADSFPPVPEHRILTYAYMLSGGLIWEQTFSSPYGKTQLIILSSFYYSFFFFFQVLVFQSHLQMYDWLLVVRVLATMSLPEKSFLWTFLNLYCFAF